ncbi:unnamed protein product [Paramecium sonneborni]|uniref:RBR-type E3 ubiquitin transferase n=1 Tax=Paramecium sonneborni TaxID=65129 RepID=A0A8S1LED7_9CILI|nr:unnamed protein product [Paramecium sonneborni]
MGQSCKKASTIEEINYEKFSPLYDKNQQLECEREYQFTSYQEEEQNSNMSMNLTKKRNGLLKLLNQGELYQEFQDNLKIQQNNSTQNLQIILNINLYCNFKKEEINFCLQQINENIEYKENLQLIGIYRQSPLNYHLKEICLLCSSENIECYSLKCSHIFCKDCWSQMIEIQLSNYIPIVKCLQNQCLERLPHQFLELNQSYKDILVKRMLENDKSYTWCPGIDCPNIYKVYQTSQEYECKCGVKFCSHCKIESHYPISCQIFKKITEYKEPMQSWIKLDISQCPNCNRYIQKSQGCIQIQCVCGNDFCTKCSLAWNQEHGTDFYNCPFQDYNKNPSKLFIQMSKKESSITKVLSELEYYQKLLCQQIKDVYDDQDEISGQIFVYKKNLQRLKNFLKFEKIAIFFNYYLNEILAENELDHQCEKYSLEIINYYRILQNQVLGILFKEQKIEKMSFENFQNIICQMDQNLKIQKKCLKKEIKRIQGEMLQQTK